MAAATGGDEEAHDRDRLISGLASPVIEESQQFYSPLATSISNGGRTFTSSEQSAARCGVRMDQGTGVYKVTYRVDTLTRNNNFFGFVDDDNDLSQPPACGMMGNERPQGLGWSAGLTGGDPYDDVAMRGELFHAVEVDGDTLPHIAEGDTFGFELDTDTRTVHCFKNGVQQGRVLRNFPMGVWFAVGSWCGTVCLTIVELDTSSSLPPKSAGKLM
eukprot:m.368673 g.368673  ORF g.368673 m.368673 type:complete len:216 (-) comp19981_c0_seq2:107-754(-)